MKPRDNLIKKYPRYHYNKLGKTKLSFETKEEAKEYINKMNFLNYTIYLCQNCNKYHIGHK